MFQKRQSNFSTKPHQTGHAKCQVKRKAKPNELEEAFGSFRVWQIVFQRGQGDSFF